MMIAAVNEFLDDLRGGRMVDSPIVTVKQGQVQGKISHSPNGKAFYSFQGIPYAKPPIGSLRFKAPQPAEQWEGVWDATTEGNSSAQIDAHIHKQYLGDENCLFLNIYTPNLDGEFLPVMVYIHGGGFYYGSGSAYLHGGDYLVEKDVVVVTINYRLGALGFLSLNTPEVPGNAGLKDMVQALRWIKENIKSFGGNSGNVTVFGESAGGASTCLLTASPLSKDLISKAIIQSGTALSCWSFQHNPIGNAVTLARELGCDSSDINDILEYLMTTPVKDIIEASDRMHLWEGLVSGKAVFAPVVEKEFAGVEAFLTEAFNGVLTSGRVADIPIMIGTAALELTLDRGNDLESYIPEELHINKGTEESLAIAKDIEKQYFKGDPKVDRVGSFHLFSDVTINLATHRYVQYLLNVKNKPIYYYKFAYVGKLNISDVVTESTSMNYAGHMDELSYLFRNEIKKHVEPTSEDNKTRERVLRLWTNFAKTGNPTPDVNHYLTLTWLPVTKEKMYYLNIDKELSLETSPDKEKMEFWDDLYNKHFKIWEHPKTNEAVAPVSAIIVDTSPVIIEETIITTVTTVVDEKGEEKTNTEVIVDVQDSTGQHYQETFNDLKANEEIFKPDNSVNSMMYEKTVVTPDVLIVSGHDNVDDRPEKLVNIVKLQEKFQNSQNGGDEFKFNGNYDRKPRPSNEVKMVANPNNNPKDVIRANDPPEDDLPKNIGVNKFVNFFESLGGKK